MGWRGSECAPLGMELLVGDPRDPYVACISRRIWESLGTESQIPGWISSGLGGTVNSLAHSIAEGSTLAPVIASVGQGIDRRVLPPPPKYVSG